MGRNFAVNGLQMICEALKDRNQWISQYRTEPVDNSNDDADQDCPVFDAFYAAGGVVAKLNFSPMEFRNLWNNVHNYVVSHWNVGRGRKSSQKSVDVIFMTLKVLKQGAHKT